jgi:hypothetical protein
MYNLPARFLEITPKNWKEAKEIGQLLDRTCVFRGVDRKEWPLRTSIERAAEQFNCPNEEIWFREKDILRTFQSRAHHYIQSPPNEGGNVEWLSLVQHHGGPTRLLDFTESFYVASFFAVENSDSDACVWAVNRAVLAGKITDKGKGEFVISKKYSRYSDDSLSFADEFISNPKKKETLTLIIHPPRMNERLAVQKGLFLFPCDLESGFEINLCASFDLPFNALDSNNAQKVIFQQIQELHTFSTVVWKINLPKKDHPDIIRDLYSMNIDAASLFPGLDGFARSLSYSVRDFDQEKRRYSSITFYDT